MTIAREIPTTPMRLRHWTAAADMASEDEVEVEEAPDEVPVESTTTLLVTVEAPVAAALVLEVLKVKLPVEFDEEEEEPVT